MLVRDTHLYVTWIGEVDLVGAVDIPDPVARKLCPRFDAAGAAELGVERPVHRVVVMRAPAGDHAQAMGLAPQPARPAVPLLRVYTLLGVVDLGCASEPLLVAQVRRN